MARTTSATRRQSLVLTAAIAAGQRQLTRSLLVLGKGDTARGICILCAGLLTFAGCLAPQTDAQTLTAVLFLAGAALALIAANRSIDLPGIRTGSLIQDPPSSVPPANAQRARPLPRTLAELASLSETRGAADAAHWQRLTQRMSHEMRTPLNAVIGFSELMSCEVFGPLSPQYSDYVRSIQSSGRVLLKSTEDALAITNLLTRNPLRPFNPVASVQTGLDDMLAFHSQDAAAAGIEITGFCGADRDIAVEAQTLRQILINMMSEAIALAGQGARISYDCGTGGDDISIRIALTCCRIPHRAGEDSFGLILARTLLQLSQGRLEEEFADGCWSVTAILPRAAQSDFFTVTH